MEENFSTDQGQSGFGMIQVDHMYCALSFFFFKQFHLFIFGGARSSCCPDFFSSCSEWGSTL